MNIAVWPTQNNKGPSTGATSGGALAQMVPLNENEHSFSRKCLVQKIGLAPKTSNVTLRLYTTSYFIVGFNFV